MTIFRMMLGVASKGVTRNLNYVQQQKQMTLLPSTTMIFGSNNFASDSKTSKTRKYRVNHLTKGMALTSSSGQTLTLEHSNGKILEPGRSKSLKLVPTSGEPNTQPLVVLLPWLMSKQQHVNKFEKLYLKLGYDVLTARITPWQLLWPAKGSQLVAGDMLGFLEANTDKRPLLVHGFSVGGYLWGELLVHVERNRERYSELLKRIMGSVWDSAADMQDIQTGLPVAVFPKNLMLQKALQKYTKYHMSTFYEGATQHYIRSSQMFHSSIIRSPALMMFSERDPIGNPDSNLRVRDNWESLGIKTYVKCWEKSHHVGHYRRYPEEYVAEIASFLATIGMLPVACKMQAKANL